MGNKADLYALTETLLYYGCEDTVWEEVTEWNDAVKEDKNSSKSTFFNFDRLYIRQADRFLFLDNNTEEAAKIGTYIHGLAGDVAQKKQGMIGMIASDIITCLPTAWRLVSE